MHIGKILLPSLALALGVATSTYFLAYWWRHRDGGHTRSLLLWAIALFLFYWFQLPAIFVGLGKVITLTDFNLFFSLTFPITLLALILIYLGILQMAGIRLSRPKKIFFFVYFALAVLFFSYYFISRKGIIEDYALPLVGNIAFYLPMRLLIIFTIAKITLRTEFGNAYGTLGAAVIISEGILGLIRNFIVIKTVLAYPPHFWYMAFSGSKFFFITQTISVIFLAFGFYLLHLSYHHLYSSDSGNP